MTMIIYDIGNIASWLSAIGTVAAVIVSLVLAVKNSRRKLKITCTVTYRSNDRTSEDYFKPIFKINVLNDGYKAVHIINRRVYRKGFLFKKYDYQQLRKENNFEKTIEIGQLYRFDIDFHTDPFWALLGVNLERCKKAVVKLEDASGKTYKKTIDITYMNNERKTMKLRHQK